MKLIPGNYYIFDTGKEVLKGLLDFNFSLIGKHGEYSLKGIEVEYIQEGRLLKVENSKGELIEFKVGCLSCIYLLNAQYECIQERKNLLCIFCGKEYHRDGLICKGCGATVETTTVGMYFKVFKTIETIQGLEAYQVRKHTGNILKDLIC